MKRVIIGCLGATALLVAVGTFTLWFLLVRELPVLDTTLSLPSEVAMGSTVSMVITASNPHKEPVTLDSVDMDDSFLSGFQVVGIAPEPTDTMHVPLVNQRSWSFEKQVAPGESISVSFELKPVMEGHFSGDVDVCNPNQDFTTLYADVVATKAVAN
jgi:hypothetical protein